MLDSVFLIKNWETAAPKLLGRGVTQETLDNFKRLQQEGRKAITEAERLKARHNVLSQQVGELKKSGKDAAALMEEIHFLKEQFDKANQDAKDRGLEMSAIFVNIPNLTRDEVPVGKSEADNVVVKTHLSDAAQRTWDFTPKPHWELGEELRILDLERAAKISGARFAVYMGAGARLERALISFMLDIHTRKHGYTEVLPPFMVNSASLFGTGQLPKFA
jgi:seryl-tRNA synthetase